MIIEYIYDGGALPRLGVKYQNKPYPFNDLFINTIFLCVNLVSTRYTSKDKSS